MPLQRISGVQRLWLIRHGLTTWNTEKRFCGHTDLPLTSQGLQQAAWVAQQLAHEPLSAIYTSTLLRAQQTADAIVYHHHPLAPAASPLWNETSFGAWEGLTYAEIAQRYPNDLLYFSDPLHHSPPDGEPFMHLVQRVRDGLSRLIQDIQLQTIQGDVVLVSHGGTLRILLCHILGVPFERQWQFRLDHGSISALDFVLGENDITQTATLAVCNYHPALFSQ